MRKYQLTIIAILILISFYNLAFCQSIGISFGTGTYNSNLVNNFLNTFPNPNNLLGHFYLSVNHTIKINFSSGYGYGNILSEKKNVSESWFSGEPVITEEKTKIWTKGFPVETEILFSKSFSEKGTFLPFLGIGIGYYNYNIKIESKDDNLENKIKGFAQYFTLGFNVKVSSRYSTFIQLKKLGISNIKSEGNIPIYSYFFLDSEGSNTYKDNVISKASFQDIGIAIGFVINL